MIHEVIRGGTTFDPVPRFGGGIHVTHMYIISLLIQPNALRSTITGFNLLKTTFGSYVTYYMVDGLDDRYSTHALPGTTSNHRSSRGA